MSRARTLWRQVDGRPSGRPPARQLLPALALLVATGLLLGGPLRGAAAGSALVASRGGPEGLVQLHFLAASDRPADQRDKERVVRALLPVIVRDLSHPSLPAGPGEAERVLERARQRRTAWAALAERVLRRAGSGQRVEVAVGYFRYPAKRTGSLWLPAAVYPAVEVRLGPARGHNWWCLLFPQLCLPLASGQVRQPVPGHAGRGEGKDTRPAAPPSTATEAAFAPADPWPGAADPAGSGEVLTEYAFRLDEGTPRLSRQDSAPRFRLALLDWFHALEPRVASGFERARLLLAEP
ncbi:MAG: stage II sporulation protein R [Bacillota bacterium]|nr:stage II sporulation protein R [Bacillota bacterium]